MKSKIIHSTRSMAFTALALIALSVMGILAFATYSQAHTSPGGCDSTGVSLSLTVLRADGVTSVGAGSVTPGETIKYRATLSHAGGSNCNYDGGDLDIITPDGANNDVDGGAITLVTSGTPFVGSLVTYVVDSADVGGDGDMDASAVYTGGTSHLGGNVTPVGATTPASTPFVKLDPGITTEVHSPPHVDITSGSVGIGTAVHDKAIVTASGTGPTPTGSVAFSLHANSSCTGASTTQVVALAAGVAESSATSTLATGSYSYLVVYSGDDNYNQATALCEPFTVTKASPGIQTTPSAGGPIGTVLNDTATLSGGSSPTGNVTFKLFAPGDTTCSGTPLYTEVDPSSPYGTSPGFTTLVAGTYRWTADYAGDSNNNPVSSGCQDEQVVITQPVVQYCSPGYWKNHPGSWVTYTPGQSFSSVFEPVTILWSSAGKPLPLASSTLMQGLEANGGGLNQLVRATVTALLNTSAGLSTGLTTGGIIAAFNSTHPGTNAQYAALAAQFTAPENCPLN